MSGDPFQEEGKPDPTLIEEIQRAEKELENRLKHLADQVAPTEVNTPLEMLAKDHSELLAKYAASREQVAELRESLSRANNKAQGILNRRQIFFDQIFKKLPETLDSTDPEVIVMSWVDLQVAMVDRVTKNMEEVIASAKALSSEEGPTQPMINAKQILGLMSLSWPDGNYEASPDDSMHASREAQESFEKRTQDLPYGVREATVYPSDPLSPHPPMNVAGTVVPGTLYGSFEGTTEIPKPREELDCTCGSPDDPSVPQGPIGQCPIHDTPHA